MTAPTGKNPQKTISKSQKIFVDCYLANGRDRAAAIRAMKPEWAGMKTGMARRLGQQYLDRLPVKNALKALADQDKYITEKVLDKYGVSRERVIEELARIAFTNVDDIVTWDADGVKVKPSAELTPEAKAAIAEVGEVYVRDGFKNTKVKNHDKSKALEALARTLGMFAPEQHEHKHLVANLIIEK